MSSFLRNICTALLSTAMLTVGAGCSRSDSQPTELLVGAAASLEPTLRDAADAYARVAPDVRIIFTFGGSGMLRQQIENAAPIDVFLAAAEGPIDSLERHGFLVPGSRRALARNRLVIVQRPDRAPLNKLTDLTMEGIHRIAIGEPRTVPAGAYALEAFRSAGLFDRVQDRLIYAKDVRQVLLYVETGAVDAGVVYETDARTAERARTAVTIPDEIHTPIIYPGAVVAASSHREAAAAFLEYLSGPAGQEFFATHGFLEVR